MSSWTLEDSSRLYKLPHWGDGLFQINDSGHLGAPLARGHEGRGWICTPWWSSSKRGGLTPDPIRLTDVLQHRVRPISDSFLQAMDEHSYQGDYRGVYPLKVNQQRKVVEDLVQWSTLPPRTGGWLQA